MKNDDKVIYYRVSFKPLGIGFMLNDNDDKLDNYAKRVIHSKYLKENTNGTARYDGHLWFMNLEVAIHDAATKYKMSLENKRYEIKEKEKELHQCELKVKEIMDCYNLIDDYD